MPCWKTRRPICGPQLANHPNAARPGVRPLHHVRHENTKRTQFPSQPKQKEWFVPFQNEPNSRRQTHRLLSRGTSANLSSRPGGSRSCKIVCMRKTLLFLACSTAAFPAGIPYLTEPTLCPTRPEIAFV